MQLEIEFVASSRDQRMGQADITGTIFLVAFHPLIKADLHRPSDQEKNKHH